MFPTCSKSDLAGRNALSAAARTIFLLHAPGQTRAAIEAYGIPVSGANVHGMFAALGGNRDRPIRTPRRAGAALATLAGALALAACGGDRQDAGAVEGVFPIDVTEASFPVRQRASKAPELKLAVRNAGNETLPNLAVSMFVDEEAGDAFSIRLDDPTLADPDRPVWILEEKYPQVLGEPLPSGLSGATTAEANTFAFGPLEPGERREMVWLLTPVRGGSYVLNYEIDAGLQGPAPAATQSGAQVGGEWPVRISERPTKQRVDGRGKVVDR